MAIVWEGHAVVEFKDLQDVVQQLQDTIKEYYVRKDQYEKDIKELRDEIAKLRSPYGEAPMDPEAKEIYEKLLTTGLSLTLVEHYDPAIHNEKDVVYTDRRGNQWMNGLPISETTEERVVYRSPVYKSIDSVKEESKEEPKHELTEFTQADLDAYSSKAFGSASKPAFTKNPSVDECRSKWDDLHKTLQSQWDDLGGSNGNK